MTAIWSDLPVEVTDQILDLCDDDTLLSLADVDQLNHQALHTLFKREHAPCAGAGFYIYRSTPHLFMEALDLTVWKTYLPRLVYRFDPDPQLLSDQVIAITYLLDRASVVEQLGLYLSSVDRYFRGKTRITRPTITVPWREAFITLLETALRKGCRQLRLRGGPTIGLYPPLVYPSPLQPQPQSQPRALPKRSGWFGACLGFNRRKLSSPSPPIKPSLPPVTSFITPTPPQVASFTTSSPSLTFLDLRCPMMLQSLFFPHTHSLIHNHSSVLRKLKLIDVKVAKSVWEEFLPSLSLPILEEFVYRDNQGPTRLPVITPGLLLEFFVRHSTIRKLKLYDIGMEEFPDFEPTTLLPNLVALDAYPRVISWLLQHPNVFPDLVYVSFTPELSRDDPNSFTYATFNVAIFSLSSRLTFASSSSSLDYTNPKPICLQFKFNTDHGLIPWFKAHLTDPSKSPLQCLKGIENISISIAYYVRLGVGVLPTFLGLCPSLRWLRFHGFRGHEEWKAVLCSEQFVGALKKQCPLLEGCVVEGVWVFGEKEYYGEECGILFGYKHVFG